MAALTSELDVALIMVRLTGALEQGRGLSDRANRARDPNGLLGPQKESSIVTCFNILMFLLNKRNYFRLHVWTVLSVTPVLSFVDNVCILLIP